MAIVLADGRAASAAGAVSGDKIKAFLNLDFISRGYWGGTVASATYDKQRMVQFIHGVSASGGTDVGGTTAFRYESPAVAKAVYAYMTRVITATVPTTIATDLSQNTVIDSVTPTSGAAATAVKLISQGLFVTGGKVTLNNITNSEELDCVTTFGSSNDVSFLVPAGVTAARVYDVIWSHPDGYYSFILASFTAA